ncbi:Organic hydroperoxide resistance transcriptional regulator [Agromyces sp. NDB4Y10]|uniref:MarR family transcriptional regulator n=1 Tax=Agromyces indicus TaxID=758919 RepID=A0ABU1FKE7_9MICO|nr:MULTISPECIES: MarR family transcriptional regulator [Agromyces]KZE95164.1 Organic hydroperoxide resistance transcriptional regulator [Agromyces sp. NDB4Y10]MDR5691755.1 MarR family transcriptional regulator [Agromyces indicus]
MTDPLELDRQLCFALAATSREVVRLYRPSLEPLGITHPQYLVLLALWERSPQRLREVAERLHLEPATVSPLIGRLEAAGLVTRSRSAADERAVDIALTDEGTALREQALRVPGEVVERLGYSVERLERLRDELTSLLDAAHAVN